MLRFTSIFVLLPFTLPAQESQPAESSSAPIKFALREIPEQPTSGKLHVGTFSGSIYGDNAGGAFRYRTTSDGETKIHDGSRQWNAPDGATLGFACEGCPGAGGTFHPGLLVLKLDDGRTGYLLVSAEHGTQHGVMVKPKVEDPLSRIVLFNGNVLLRGDRARVAAHPLAEGRSIGETPRWIGDPDEFLEPRYLIPQSGMRGITLGHRRTSEDGPRQPIAFWMTQAAYELIELPLPEGAVAGSAGCGTSTQQPGQAPELAYAVGWVEFEEEDATRRESAAWLLDDDEFVAVVLPRLDGWTSAEAIGVQPLADVNGVLVAGVAQTADGPRAVYWFKADGQDSWEAFDATEVTTELADDEVVTAFGDVLVGWGSLKTSKAWYVFDMKKPD